MKIYVASSWRNEGQPAVVNRLREAGHEVYDFRNPKPGENGFHWQEIDHKWGEWTPEQHRNALEDPIAVDGFANDWNGMKWADCCVMLMPCGRSAHLECGYFVGAKKRSFIVLGDKKSEPELMYKLVDKVCVDVNEVLDEIGRSSND